MYRQENGERPMIDMGFEARQLDLRVHAPNQERNKKQSKLILVKVENDGLENFTALLKVEEDH